MGARSLGRVLACALLLASVGACSSGSGEGGSGPTVAGGGSATTAGRGAPPARALPPGPSAQLEKITAGGTPFIAAGNAIEVPAGYTEEEFIASGTASTYTTPATLSGDGKWTFQPGTTAPYRTRVVVRRPSDPAKFSGTALVEWLNVSGGADANPDYVSLAEEIVRQGHAWVGVSAQLIGVEGGPVLVKAPGGEGIAGRGLKALDPARYGSLSHPGDGFSFDIYSQVARAVRDGGAITGGATPAATLAVGESQSAVALTTYYNGVQPLTELFDGFFVHSRGSFALPVVEAGKSADLAGSMSDRTPILFRTDVDAPVLDLQTEGDLGSVLSSISVRQPDSDRFRLWEVAGTAHADLHLVGANASGFDCGAQLNNGPMHIITKAGLRALDEWVREGKVPKIAPRLEDTGGEKPELRRNADGIVLGGIRTPPVDVPVDVLSGIPGPNPEVICILFGSTTPLTDARLAELYPSRDAYQQQYRTATDASVASGFVLAEDRDALLGFAQPDRVRA